MDQQRTRLLGTVAVAGAIGACGLTTLAGALFHARSYRIHRRSVFLDLETETGDPLRVLHLSDMHLLASDTKRMKFLSSLTDTSPDFVVVTGDFIAENAAIDAVVSALDPLLDIPGAFVFGSNDYHAPQLRNPASYLVRNSNEKSHEPGPRLDTDLLARLLEGRGWLNLTNTRAVQTVDDWTISLVGVDDPHMDLDRFPAGHPTSEANLSIGVSHAPYTRVLDAMASEGNDVVFAGHTHGGQICLPGGRALVTNCDLDPRFAAGLFSWPPHDQGPIKEDGAIIVDDARTAINVSAGLGTSPYTPIRTFCPPEAIIVDIVPANAGDAKPQDFRDVNDARAPE